MQLLQPQEVEVYYILPAIRKELTLALKARGKTQQEIAITLGVTPAAVSQYIHEKRATMDFPKELKNKVRDAAKRITDKQSMIKEVQAILKDAWAKRIICTMHAQLTDIPEGCEVCYEEKG